MLMDRMTEYYKDNNSSQIELQTKGNLIKFPKVFGEIQQADSKLHAEDRRLRAAKCLL